MRLRKESILKRKILNLFQSFLIIIGTAVLLGIVSFLIFGPAGAAVALLSWLFLVFVLPAIDPKSILRLYKGRLLNYYEMPNLYKAVYNLSKNASLENPPKIYYIKEASFTAFSTGSKSNSAIALSDALLRILNDKELYGVLAHEISHIKNNDIWIMQLTDIASRIAISVAYIGQGILILLSPFIFFDDTFYFLLLFFLFLLIPPLIVLMQLCLSRIREYGADVDAVMLTGDPNGLKNALLKLNIIEENLFSKLFNPFPKREEPSMLRTHPDTKSRIKRLEEFKLEEYEDDFIYERDSDLYKLGK